MRVVVLIITIFLTHAMARADGFPSDARFRLDISKKGQLLINEDDGSRRVRITHEVFGYEVNCAKTRILVWGKPKNLNENNPQESILTIVNLKPQVKPAIIGFSKNIFNAVFLKDGVNAIIESDSEKLVDIAHGVLLTPSDGTPPNVNADPESCMTFPYKSYRRYKN